MKLEVVVTGEPEKLEQSNWRTFIKSVLDSCGLPYDTRHISLLYGTAATESHLGYWLKQIKGPALGIFQMEPDTIKDIQNHYLIYRPQLVKQIMKTTDLYDLESFIFNVRLQVVYAYLHYRRVPEAIPFTQIGQAKYWKDHYNTKAGKGTVDKYINETNRFGVYKTW